MLRFACHPWGLRFCHGLCRFLSRMGVPGVQVMLQMIFWGGSFGWLHWRGLLRRLSCEDLECNMNQIE